MGGGGGGKVGGEGLDKGGFEDFDGVGCCACAHVDGDASGGQ